MNKKHALMSYNEFNQLILIDKESKVTINYEKTFFCYWSSFAAMCLANYCSVNVHV